MISVDNNNEPIVALELIPATATFADVARKEAEYRGAGHPYARAVFTGKHPSVCYIVEPAKTYFGEV